MTEEISPENIVSDLTYAQELKDTRLLILFLHLYVEHFIKQLSKEKRVKEGSLRKNARKLQEIGVFDKDVLNVIELVYDLRNELIHYLKPDYTLLERWIKEFIIPFEYEPHKYNEIQNLAKIIESSGSIIKIQIIGIPVIFNLYKKLKEIRKEEIEYEMELKLSTIPIFDFNIKKMKKTEGEKGNIL